MTPSPDVSRDRIGVLGLGRMGLPIATALAAAGFDVRAFDSSPERAALATDAGLLLAATAIELAKSVEVLVTVLPGPGEVTSALIDGGLLDQLAPGSLWLDLTSNAPDVADLIAGIAAARGVLGVSAPMAGGPAAAEARTLRFFVGGDSTAVDRARPLLSALGGDDASSVIGSEVGSAHTAKLLTNLLWFGQAVAVTEALLLGVSLGLPIRTLSTTLASGAGGSRFIDEYLDSLLAGDYLGTFGIDRCVEELDTLVRLAERADIPFEISRTVARLHREALERFGAIDGELLASRLLEERAGIALRDDTTVNRQAAENSQLS